MSFLITLHENLLDKTPEKEVEKRLALQAALVFLRVSRDADPDEWYFGKDDETYEGEFTQVPVAKGN